MDNLLVDLAMKAAARVRSMEYGSAEGPDAGKI